VSRSSKHDQHQYNHYQNETTTSHGAWSKGPGHDEDPAVSSRYRRRQITVYCRCYRACMPSIAKVLCIETTAIDRCWCRRVASWRSHKHLVPLMGKVATATRDGKQDHKTMWQSVSCRSQLLFYFWLLLYSVSSATCQPRSHLAYLLYKAISFSNESPCSSSNAASSRACTAGREEGHDGAYLANFS